MEKITNDLKKQFDQNEKINTKEETKEETKDENTAEE